MDIHIVQTRFFAGVLCALLTASCTYNIRVAPPDFPAAQISQIPDRVGVFYAPDFMRHDLDDSISSEYDFRLRTDIGPASVATFNSTLSAIFPNLVRVAAVSFDDDIQIVLVPAIESFDYELQSSGTARTSVSIIYSLTILRYDGLSVTMTIPGEYEFDRGHTLKPAPIWSFAEKCIQAALRSAASNLLFALNAAAKSDDWLAEIEKMVADRESS